MVGLLVLLTLWLYCRNPFLKACNLEDVVALIYMSTHLTEFPVLPLLRCQQYGTISYNQGVESPGIHRAPIIPETI